MKKFIQVILISLVFSSIVFSQNSNVSLGKLKPFWRNHPVLGPFLQDGLWIQEVPDYMLNTDFAYKKRPFAKEVLFADHLSVVRLLGGTDSYPDLVIAKKTEVNSDGTMKKSKFSAEDTASIRKLSEYDYAFRKKDGTLGFRPELIVNRLKSYTDNGYTSFTIVLDNVPWCLIKTPLIGSFGQTGPPDNQEEWYQTVRELCITLKTILGEENANKLRFRIGTEMNGKERFNGTEDQFITHFDYAAAAIADVLPGARLGLFNISAVSIKGIQHSHNVNAFHLLKHATTEPNRKTGKSYGALPFVAASRYFCEKVNLNDICGGLVSAWDYVHDSIPGYTEFSREIHEWGAIGDWAAKPPTSNPDAFGNAMNLQVLLDFNEKGIDRLFHWNLLESVKSTKQDEILIPNSQAWGYSVLNYMSGGEAYKLTPQPTIATDKTTHSALLSVFDKKAYLLVNAYNTSRTSHNKNMVTLKIEKKSLPFKVKILKSASMNNANCVGLAVRLDIEQAGILNPIMNERPEGVFNLKDMTNNLGQAKTLVIQNWDKYKSIWKKSLTLETFKGKITEDANFYTITLEMAAPESTVIVLTEKK